VDEAMACLMPPPHTYTREAVAEVHCHGGAVAPRRVLAVVLASGARIAEPGEFTLRAFLNGRLDLARAEAVLDVVEARTDAQLRLAFSGLGGRLSERVRAIRGRAIELLAELTATIDFPEDDVPEHTLRPRVHTLNTELTELLATADHGALIRSGIRVAIVGPPNAGKSTLLNALLGRERAIVSPTPGTTRDTIEESVNLDGVPLVLVDTAGLRLSDDAIERSGVGRSQAEMRSADLIVLVLDGSAPAEAIPELPRQPDLVVANKADLPSRLSTQALDLDAPVVAVSALTGLNLDELRRRLVPSRPALSDEAVVANERHRALLEEARSHLAALLDDRYVHFPDQTAARLAAAVDALGQITGETATEELLTAIFSRFCIGK
jgi:tRNA modification GTPase